jgi:predicted component of type VI protein secretion system
MLSVILDGKTRGGETFRYEISSELLLQNPSGLLIGSGGNANIEIHDPSLRPIHARILLSGSNEVRFSGIGTAPVFVNGSALPAGGQSVLLANGTTVQIGEITLTVAITA